MPDWTQSMQLYFEYYLVDPVSWKDTKMLTFVKSANVQRDLNADTLGSATIEMDEKIDECYIRIYLVTIQNGITEKTTIGTYIVQTPNKKFDGLVSTYSMNAYTPLIELKETKPPLGYTIFKDYNAMDIVKDLTSEHLRAPVLDVADTYNMYSNFTSDPEDTWLTYLKNVMAYAEYSFMLDPEGRVGFIKNSNPDFSKPKWIFTDDNSSILYPSITVSQDIYGMPNVLELVYTSSGGSIYTCRVVNDDPNSPISTINRGREIVHRELNPQIPNTMSEEQVELYAKELLASMSKLEYTITFDHGYCPVTIGDYILINYTRAGLRNISAKVITQSITCDTECKIQTTASYYQKLWGN